MGETAQCLSACTNTVGEYLADKDPDNRSLSECMGGDKDQQADKDHQAACCSEVRSIGEEGPGGKLLKQPPRSDEPVWWVIDPIDGTTNFAHRILCYNVSIAVMYEGRPIAGVVFDPTTDSMFTAVKGGDAQFNTTRIKAGEESINEFACFGVDSHVKDEYPKGIADTMKRTRFRNMGSMALHMAYVAKGSMIGTTGFEAKLWDIAAGAFIIEQAGGIG